MTTFYQRHGRPKPPKIYGTRERIEYETDHPRILSVWKWRTKGDWTVCADATRLDAFPTHAEAIAYAHDRVRQSGGEISGA